jgi:hypothetical protein
MIFQSQLSTLDTELSQLQALLDAKRQQRSLFEQLDAETNTVIEAVALLKTKIEAVGNDAIASLKSAVLTLFDSGDGGNDGGNQPTHPTPGPDDDEPELLCLNGETGECLTTADLDEADANAVPCPTCGADLNDETNYPEYTAAALAGICRSCEESAIEAEKAAQAEDDTDSEINTGTPLTYAQAIKNRCSACWGYEVRSKGDIKSGFINRTDLNFMEAVNLERSGREFYETVETYLDRLYYNGQVCEWASPFASPFACPIEPIPQPQKSSTEMIHTSARTGYLRLKANGQILSSYAWFPRKDLAEAWFDWLDGMSLGLPELRLSQRNSSWKYEIKLTGLSMTQIERLSQEDLGRKPSKKKESPAQAAGIEPPSDWGKPQPKEDSPQLFAKVLLAESEYHGQTLPVSRVSANEIGYTLTLPNGDNRWYRADMVQVLDAEIDKNASPTEPAQPEDEAVLMAENREEIEAIEFNDIVQVTSDGNDCVGLVGTFGRVKVVKGDRIGVEIDNQLVYFKPSELSVKAKAEVPKEQQQLQSGQTLLGSRTVTSGNYFGAARRSAIANARRGTADKIAALELVKAGLSPELAMAAATGADDASDF